MNKNKRKAESKKSLGEKQEKKALTSTSTAKKKKKATRAIHKKSPAGYIKCHLNEAGNGVVATADISAYSVVYSGPLLFKLEPSSEHSLSDSELKRMERLCLEHKLWPSTPDAMLKEAIKRGYINDEDDAKINLTSKVKCYVACNSWAHEDIDTGDPLHFVYSGASKFNHSCWPNALPFIDKRTKMMRIYALEPISYGTEIRIAYIGDIRALTGSTVQDRQAYLMEYHKFRCNCDYCDTHVTDLSSERFTPVRDNFMNLRSQLDLTKKSAGPSTTTPPSDDKLAALVALRNAVHADSDVDC